MSSPSRNKVGRAYACEPGSVAGVLAAAGGDASVAVADADAVVPSAADGAGWAIGGMALVVGVGAVLVPSGTPPPFLFARASLLAGSASKPTFEAINSRNSASCGAA